VPVHCSRERKRQHCTPVPLAHVDGIGKALFQRVCEMDLEGVVAKHELSPYVADRESSTWFKILNSGYSQRIGREEFFERDRHTEPVAGWHDCTLIGRGNLALRAFFRNSEQNATQNPCEGGRHVPMRPLVNIDAAWCCSEY